MHFGHLILQLDLLTHLSWETVVLFLQMEILEWIQAFYQ